MKRSQYLALLVPAFAATLVSAINFFYSWKYHSIYLSQGVGYQRVEEKLKSLQTLATHDLDFIVKQVQWNHQHTQDTADMFWHFGAVLAGLALLIAVFVYQTSKRLTYKDRHFLKAAGHD
jgi:hypothetical protein